MSEYDELQTLASSMEVKLAHAIPVSANVLITGDEAVLCIKSLRAYAAGIKLAAERAFKRVRNEQGKPANDE